MSIIATAVKHLIAAGVTGDALVTAIAEMEASIDTRSTAAKRQARYRARKDNEASQSVTKRNAVTPKENSPQTPLKEITPLSPKGDIPPFDFQTEWNEIAKPAGLDLCQAMNKDRKGKLRQRLAEHGVDGLRKAMMAAAASPFCRGVNDRNWTAGPDFVLQSSSCLKLIEGAYAAKQKPANDAGGSFLAHLTGHGP